MDITVKRKKTNNLTIGIYKISNNITKECYIGQSINIENRWKEHKSLLTKDIHFYNGSKKRSVLQNSWNKYGGDNFLFSVLEICLFHELDEKERYWINFVNSNRNKTGYGYNLSDGGCGTRGYKYTDEDKLKVSISNKGRVHLNNGEQMKYVFPNEVKKYLDKGFKYGELPRKNVENYRKGSIGNTNVKGRIQVNNGIIQKMIYPEELEQFILNGFVIGRLDEYIKMSVANKPIFKGESHWHYGKKQSKETIKKRSESMMGKPSWIKGKITVLKPNKK